MQIRSRAPLRIGLAGGGTDLTSYSDKYGGCVFNATVGMYSYCTIVPVDDGKIRFVAPDRGESVEVDAVPYIEPTEPLILHKGVYNRIVKQFNGGKPLSLFMSTSSDAPPGSGLGTSSTMVVAILEAYNRWLNLKLSEYSLARLAYEIEREDLQLKGGKQDQYAAVFGGFSFMEFNPDGSVIVNGLRVDKHVIYELECSLLLFYSGKSHDSSKVISQQIANTAGNKAQTVEAMHGIKQAAIKMKDAVLRGDVKQVGAILNEGWEQKKRTSSVVTNSEIDSLVEYAKANGAEAVKLSGAGGGGFILMYCDPVNRQKLLNALKQLKGDVLPVKFCKEGAESWTV